jgi:hypothetical protein
MSSQPAKMSSVRGDHAGRIFRMLSGWLQYSNGLGQFGITAPQGDFHVGCTGQ